MWYDECAADMRVFQPRRVCYFRESDPKAEVRAHVSEEVNDVAIFHKQAARECLGNFK